MPTHLLRPTPVKGRKNESEWVAYGPWGRLPLGVMSANEMRRKLHGDLIADEVLPSDSPAPSNKNHGHVTMALARCSRIEDRWVPDAP